MEIIGEKNYKQKNEEYLEMQAEDEVFGDIHAYDIAKNEYYLENDIKPLSYDAWQFAWRTQA